MKIKVYTADGAKSTEKEFDKLPVFEGDKGVQALKETIVAYQANARQGNAHTKNFGEVQGTGKKPWRQKGTGMARHGSKRSPIWRGGAVVFGPRTRDWSKKINKRVRALAFTRALFERARDGELALIETLAPAQPKTKAFNEVLRRIKPEGKILIVDETFTDETILAGRNIARLHFTEAASLNAWDLVQFDCILISEKGFEKVLARTAD